MNKRESERKRRKEINLHDANFSPYFVGLEEEEKINHVKK